MATDVVPIVPSTTLEAHQNDVLALIPPPVFLAGSERSQTLVVGETPAVTLVGHVNETLDICGGALVVGVPPDEKPNLVAKLKKVARTPVKFPGVFETGIELPVITPTRIDRNQVPIGVLVFVMRAFKTSSPTGHVYWSVINEPDANGDLSPFPTADLTDVVIAGIYDI
jgi:hypothetical protein